MKKEIRCVAMYLPQYHPINENNEWWGMGFTEWTNVTKAKPFFPGHYQPHLPADLGFYDLRLSEVREQQAELAREYGIYGFCYYHYWFNGKRLLERPFNEVLESGTPNFPFMLCWANENWSRRWDGQESHVLMAQNYSEEDDITHIRYLLENVFCDSRYIKIDGKPVFAVYRSDLFPDMKRTIDVWRAEAKKYGVDLYLCRFEAFTTEGKSYLEAGFDAAIDFQPKDIYRRVRPNVINLLNTLTNKLFSKMWLPNYFSYKKYSKFEAERAIVDYKRYPCVTPMWDNAARKRPNFTVLHGSTPDIYEEWLQSVYDKFEPYSQSENFIFINAWNEWAEGNHLEPDRRNGRKYLEATKRVLQKNK